MRAMLLFAVASASLWGCGGSTEQAGGAAATGGAGGSGASAGVGGGTAGTAAGGTGATGGTSSGGTGATGGTSSGGTAGTGGAPPECTSAADCRLWSDCCSCVALAPGETEPAPCPATCLQPHCDAVGIGSGDVACVAGRCVAGFDCASEVFCNGLPPDCTAGWVPSVSNGCWGTCVPATECLSVPSCSDCAADSTCALYVNMTGPEPHCVSIPDECANLPVCACLGSSVCRDLNWQCSDLSGIRGVSCGCPDC